MPPKVFNPHHPASCVERALDVMERLTRIGISEHTMMSVLEGKRAHLKGMVVVALGLGLRKREQLNLRLLALAQGI